MMENFEEQMQKMLREAESEPAADAWERISEAIPSRRRSRAFVWWTVGGIAAGLTLLFAVGGGTLAPVSESTVTPHVSKVVEPIVEPTAEPRREQPVSKIPALDCLLPQEVENVQMVDIQPKHRMVVDELAPLTVETPTLYADVPVVDICPISPKHQPTESPRLALLRGWHVGMGAASMGITSTDLGVQGMAYSNEIAYDAMDYGGFPYQKVDNDSFRPSSLETAPVDADHSSPCLFGVSFYRPLTEDLSLSTGVVYSQLVSRWKSDGNKSVQRLHLVGIPLSVSYRLGSFGAFRVYASAGTQMDINVDGRIKMTDYKGTVQKQHLRSKNLLWTLRGRLGVAYPLCRWAAVYGECGVDRYLNAPTGLNTLRSEKKTGYVGQIGVSIGF